MDRESMDRIAATVMGYYGSVRPWNEPRLLAHVAAQFAGYLPAKVTSAVDGWAKDNPERAPKPAELLDYMRRDAGPTTLVDPANCRHPRPLAIVDERRDTDTEDRPPLTPLRLTHAVGTRVGYCSRCGTEIVFPPGKLLTESEIADQAKQRMEAKHG